MDCDSGGSCVYVSVEVRHYCLRSELVIAQSFNLVRADSSSIVVV